MVDLVLLGTGGGIPMPFRNLASMLISYKGRKILIDCGEGTQVSMRIAKCGFKSIDVICITHCHGDHIIGLPGLLSTMGNSGREEEVLIIGPEGINKVIEGLSVVCPYLPYNIRVIENPKSKIKFSLNNKMEEQIVNPEIEIDTISLEHSTSCIGYKFNINRKPKFDIDKAIRNNVPKILWNKLQKNENVIFEENLYTSDMVLAKERKGISLCYITDSRPIDSIKDFINECDLFICEGTYGDDDDLEKAVKNKHMTFREAALLAYSGNVKNLILTHFTSAMLEPQMYIKNANEVFENVIIGEDRMTKSINFE